MPYLLLDPRRKVRLTRELEKAVVAMLPLGPERVILFGSFNRGNLNSHSDLDLLVEWRTNLSFFQRSQAFYDAVQPNVAMDIMVYTPDELKELENSNPFIHQALIEGRVIYEKGIST